MRTQALLPIAAVVLGMPDLTLLFAPDNAVGLFGSGTGAASALWAQLAGGMAIAVYDRMARGVLMSGIHRQYLLVANLGGFAIMGLSLLKGAPCCAALIGRNGGGGWHLKVNFRRLLFVHPGQ